MHRVETWGRGGTVGRCGLDEGYGNRREMRRTLHRGQGNHCWGKTIVACGVVKSGRAGLLRPVRMGSGESWMCTQMGVRMGRARQLPLQNMAGWLVAQMWAHYRSGQRG